MRQIAWATFMAVSLVAARNVAAAEFRFSGLERLYFERVAEAGPPSLHASAIRAALPSAFEGAPRAGDTLRDEDGYEVDVSIEDFALRGFGRGAGIVLRQVTDPTGRIHLVWWALYADGRRRDMWFYAAYPERTENKALANPAIEKVRAGAGNSCLVDVVSTMLRPQGAMWTSAWTLAFEVTPGGLVYRHAEERYGMSRGYDMGDTLPPPTYWTAQRLGRNVEVKSAQDVSEAILASCGSDRLDEESVARCVTSKAKVLTSSRSIETPAFIERGGKPLE